MANNTLPLPERISALAATTAAASAVALILLCLAWEMWLAPLRSGGSWLVLKTLPMLAPLPGVLRGRRYTYQWASMLVLAYLAEGIVRTMTERGTANALAMAECALAMIFFVSSIVYVRATRTVN